ncbi:N-acetylneuraminate synthase family protein [Breznakiella homolactica]|uniref:N-acetylneuraminate synthase family protein n=1 Tax=Breznakiella homolactica TaxID=2798577 RepID=A0A7T8B9J2_9SPIR|nr:N-acetylneuraminate synthase family protein [Breznakiella homolactica]QQO08015.1 N-acetylneuraminate synthase family protein [Breznakiella homolactica]
MGIFIEIDGTRYGPGNVLIIAELGTSHGGDMAKAKELVSAAAEAGADCIKFQMVYADEILHPKTGTVPLPGGPVPLYDRFRDLELPPDFYRELKEFVESLGLLFLCTPFGIRSARELRGLSPLAIKIASPELTYTALLRETASYGLPVLLSSGVSTLGDIEYALSFYPRENACILHCVTAYPAPERDYNLRVLGSLSAVFGAAVGVSDHSMDPELVPALAAAMGAAAVEKHFCLSRDDPGLDDPIALPPEDFRRMVRAVRKTSRMDPAQAAAELEQERGRGLVQAVLGDGIKRLAPSEAENYQRTNRSVHALRDIQPGESIEAGAVASLRTEKILRPGLPPVWEARVIGRKARNFIPAGEGIRFEDV